MRETTGLRETPTPFAASFPAAAAPRSARARSERPPARHGTEN